MLNRSLASIALLTTLAAGAQYGAFSAGAAKAAKGGTTIIVLDAVDTPYNKAITNAVKSDWKFTTSYDFISVAQLATQPIVPEKTYLMKLSKTDPVKFNGTFLTLVQGWKLKKGEVLQQSNDQFNGIPAQQELAFIQIDPVAINEKGMAPMLGVYMKHLQDYLKLVETGKITDKATADRTYSSRTRLIRDTDLWLAQEHLDKSIPDAAKVKEFYTAPAQVMALSQLASGVVKGDNGITVSDLILTGDRKNKHCFKRVFNAGTGELMYLNDDASIFGKKEGFIEDDLKSMERAR